MYLYKKIIILILISFLSSSVFSSDNIAVMGLIKDKVILSVDGVHYTIKKGEPPVNGIKLIDIGKNRKKVILEIDGVAMNFRLGQGTGSAIVTVKIPADASGIYRIKGKINNQQVPYIIDTGATFVSLNSNEATRLGIDYKNNSREAKSETANGLVTIYIVTLDSVEVGAIKINNVEAAIHEGEYPKQVLLGMSFLKQLKMEREGDILSLYMR